ncbi:MAG: hypothetical protein QXF40_01715 [Metallosphaera sp.]
MELDQYKDFMRKSIKKGVEIVAVETNYGVKFVYGVKDEVEFRLRDFYSGPDTVVIEHFHTHIPPPDITMLDEEDTELVCIAVKYPSPADYLTYANIYVFFSETFKTASLASWCPTTNKMTLIKIKPENVADHFTDFVSAQADIQEALNEYLAGTRVRTEYLSTVAFVVQNLAEKVKAEEFVYDLNA